jgi:hypothetical protein
LFDEAEVLKDKREMSDFYQQNTTNRVDNREYFKKLPKNRKTIRFSIETKRK